MVINMREVVVYFIDFGYLVIIVKVGVVVLRFVCDGRVYVFLCDNGFSDIDM